MAAPTLQEQQYQDESRASSAASSRRIDGGYSNRISAVDLDGDVTQPYIDHHEDHQYVVDDQKGGWRNFVAFIGPGFLVSMAYLDPNNLETDLQAGANHGFELLWVIFLGTIFAIMIQSLAANLGVSTGKHLSELCKIEYPRKVRICLWLLAETAVIDADIPEVVGTAFALRLLFHIPLWLGVLITGSSTLLLLGLQRFGVRKLELLISSLIIVLAGCFFGEMSYVKPPAKDIIKGLFIPKLSGQGAIGDVIALIGSLVNPHNLFLHSALVLSRKVPNTVHHINDACRYYLIESGFALFVAFLINLSIISVSGSVCSVANLTREDSNRCDDLSLDNASFLLKNVLGKSSSTVFGIALLASGQSSTITGTYAGQFIMQGFLDIRMRKWVRNLMTRCVAIAPSLVVVIIGGSAGAAQLIIIASMILSFLLPFILIPLLKFSSSTTKMGPYKNSIYIIVITWILGLSIVGINVFYLIKAFMDWLMHNNLPKIGNIFIGIAVFPLMVFYLVAVLYLTLRKDKVVTYIEPIIDLAKLENGQPKSTQDTVQGHLPHREDLAAVQLPE